MGIEMVLRRVKTLERAMDLLSGSVVTKTMNDNVSKNPNVGTSIEGVL